MQVVHCSMLAQDPSFSAPKCPAQQNTDLVEVGGRLVGTANLDRVVDGLHAITTIFLALLGNLIGVLELVFTTELSRNFLQLEMLALINGDVHDVGVGACLAFQAVFEVGGGRGDGEGVGTTRADWEIISEGTEGQEEKGAYRAT